MNANMDVRMDIEGGLRVFHLPCYQDACALPFLSSNERQKTRRRNGTMDVQVPVWIFLVR